MIKRRAHKPDTHLRVSPQQKRGEIRVDLILDAVEEILIEEGISGLTLTAVANRSRSAAGSMYRFFSNREQIVDAVLRRLRISLERDWVDQMKSQPETLDTGTFIGWYAETFRQLVERHPVFPAVIRQLNEHCQPLEQLAMQPLDKFLAVRAPKMTASRRAIACRLMLAMATEALQMSSKLKTVPQKQIWEGLRDALSLLLEGYLSQDGRMHRPKLKS